MRTLQVLRLVFALLIGLQSSLSTFAGDHHHHFVKLKAAISKDCQSRSDEAWKQALKIWEFAELGYKEQQSSQLLISVLEQNGFRVERGVAGMPTAFLATYGSEAPTIGLLAEYDALPGLSQQAVPTQLPRDESHNGHGCGHHLFGVASVYAAISLSKHIEVGRLKGSIKLYGCPAEEGGSGKVFLVRAGLFENVDAVMHWHPANRNAGGSRSCLSRIAVRYRFHGKSAHAAGAPEQGRSSLDAVSLCNHASELMREHTPEGTRIHHVITKGGDAPNVVPDFAEVYYYVRHPKSHIVADLYKRLTLCAKGAATATQTELEVVAEGGIVEILPNNVLAQLLLKNLKEQCHIKYDQKELEFALKLQKTFSQSVPLSEAGKVHDESGQTGRGSTDVGDVSWVVPTGGFRTACWVPGTPGHSWQATACGGTTIGKKGMDLATVTLALSAAELMSHHGLLKLAKQEHQKRLDIQPYQSLMPAGMKPPLNYRD